MRTNGITPMLTREHLLIAEMKLGLKLEGELVPQGESTFVWFWRDPDAIL